MTRNEQIRKHTTGATFLAAFLAMGLVTIALGGVGLHGLFATGRIVTDAFERPLVATDSARAASLAFARMDKEWLQRSLVKPPERRDFDRNIERLTKEFLDDLTIAETRALANSERTAILRIRDLFGQWNELRRAEGKPGAVKEAKAVAEQITQRFEVLTELIAGHTFVERRKALWSIERHKSVAFGALALALLLSAAIAFVLARRFSGPRSAQTQVTDALDHAHDGLLLVDAGKRITFANKQIGVFFPTAADHLASGGDFAAVAKLMGETFVESASSGAAIPAWEAANGDEPATDMALTGEHRLADGRWLRISRSATPDGAVLLLFSDVSEIKEREARYQDALQKANETGRGRTRFLTSINRELRAPLDAIIGFSEAISTQMFGKLGNAKYLDCAGNITRHGRHLLDIIDSLLTLAKTDAGGLKLRPEAVDIAEIIESCASEAREQCARAQLEFHVAKPEEPLLVFGEPAKLRQIVHNLLSNAIKFTNPGGEVSLFAVRTVDEQAKIRIVDTGVGMTAEEIPAALTPFNPLDSRAARRHDGAGLGLPLAKALVDLHGGRLTINSTPGHGTKVIVSLPVYRERWDHSPVKATAA